MKHSLGYTLPDVINSLSGAIWEAVDRKRRDLLWSAEKAKAPVKDGERKRLFLRVGDEVSHSNYEQWGIGVVVEVMTSTVPGGTCLARIRFQDGHLRVFDNDMDSERCCYYFGVRRYWNPSHGVQMLRSKFFSLKG